MGKKALGEVTDGCGLSLQSLAIAPDVGGTRQLVGPAEPRQDVSMTLDVVVR
jgi:hypothetical protein